ELAEWWEKFSTAYDDERHAMIEEARQSQLQKPQPARVRVRRPDAAVAAASLGIAPAQGAAAPAEVDVRFDPERDPQPGAGDDAGFAADAAPKKRRRRRKPVNREAGGVTGEAVAVDGRGATVGTSARADRNDRDGEPRRAPADGNFPD
ncbi:MAG: hypothetical protein EOO54_23400, partial [Haliea sp.]